MVYYDDYKVSWKVLSEIPQTDIEAHQTSQPSLPQVGEVSESAPLLTTATPFFHFDLIAALRAVELDSGQQVSRSGTLETKQSIVAS